MSNPHHDVIIEQVAGTVTLDAAAIVRAVEVALPKGSRCQPVAEHLAAHPDDWATGRPGPIGVQRLITALVDEGAVGVVAPTCGRCGKPRRLRSRLAGLLVCGTCYANLTAEACIRCGKTRPVALHTAQGPICNSCRRRDPSRRERCGTCAEVRPVMTRTDNGTATCVACYVPPSRRCEECGEHRPIHSKRSERPVCRSCYSLVARACGRCGRVGLIAQRATATGPDLCNRCYTPPVATCVVCGYLRPRKSRVPDGWRCASCTRDNAPQEPCAFCGRLRRVQTRWAEGPVCPGCYRQRYVVECERCGVIDHPVDRGICGRCSLIVRLDQMLGPASADDAGPLHALRVNIIETPKPRSAIGWLRGQGGELLGRVASGDLTLSHEALDAVGGRSADFLRSMLVTTGILEPRHDAIVRFERWLSDLLDEHPDVVANVVRPFATWVVLRRLRRRADEGRLTDARVRAGRQLVRQSVELMSWLERRQLGLADLDQGLLEEWLAGGNSTRYPARYFIAWAHDRHLVPRTVQIPLIPRPMVSMAGNRSQRWAQVSRLLADETVDLQLRVAGLFVLLYGQHVSRLVLLTHDDITVEDDTVVMGFGRAPIQLPPEVGALVIRLRDRRPSTTVHSDTEQQWLFSGKRAGRPITPNAILRRLHELGVDARVDRNGIVMELAAQIPTPVLADLLNLHPVSAARWRSLSQGDWNSYVARRAARPLC